MATSPAAAPNRAHAFAAALIDEIERAGVRHVVLCPGSRSTPLVVAATCREGLRCWTLLDERAAGFFALGLAKASRAPVALVCTSGTAAANFLPAVVEAHHARVPLLVLTADRPPELRDWGAAQTIDQVHLYGRFVRWYAEAPPAEATPALLRFARALGARAVAEACGRPAGPVHLNLPFREPLEPSPVPGDVPAELLAGAPLATWGRNGRSYLSVAEAAATPTPDEVADLAALLEAHPRALIVCGPTDAALDLPDAVTSLARSAGLPILADAASQLRSGPHTPGAPIVARADLLLRDARFAATSTPDLVLRFGAPPTSKALNRWLEARPPEHFVLVDPDGGFAEPGHIASRLLRADPVALCTALVRRLGERLAARRRSDWLRGFLDADRRAGAAVEERLAAEAELCEPRVVRELAESLPEGALLYVSNSMPVRDLDAFLPVSERRLRVLANRGANGIDGLVSSALGAAAAERGAVVLLTGDLAFLHDLGGLLAASRHGLRLAIVVLQNDGGGIFSFLPIAGYGEAVGFEEHFTTPHGLDFRPLVEGFGGRFLRATGWEHLRTSLKEVLAAPGLSVVEVPIDRERNVAHWRDVVAGVRLALESGR